MAPLHLGVPLRLAREKERITTPKWHAVILNVISYTCAFPAICQNVCCEKGLLLLPSQSHLPQYELRSCRLKNGLKKWTISVSTLCACLCILSSRVCRPSTRPAFTASWLQSGSWWSPVWGGSTAPMTRVACLFTWSCPPGARPTPPRASDTCWSTGPTSTRRAFILWILALRRFSV